MHRLESLSNCSVLLSSVFLDRIYTYCCNEDQLDHTDHRCFKFDDTDWLLTFLILRPLSFTKPWRICIGYNFHAVISKVL